MQYKTTEVIGTVFPLKTEGREIKFAQSNSKLIEKYVRSNSVPSAWKSFDIITGKTEF